jgi:hypothetical protein
MIINARGTSESMTAHGIPPGQLTDEDLRREMRHLHDTRHGTVLGGTAAALRTHTERMLELEHEFLRRFPDEGAPDARRTRSGSRHAAGQDDTTPGGR